MTRIVVTDGEERAALAAVRSLGQAGFKVSVCAASERSLAGASRFASDQYLTPNPLSNPGDFFRSVLGLCQDIGAEVLLPMTDAALEAILPERNRFSRICIPFPEYDAYRRISDKAGLMVQARDRSVPVPIEVRLESPSDERALKSVPAFPLVIKPSRSVVSSGREKQKVSVSRANNEIELRRQVGHYPPGAYPLLLQQHIRGTGEGAFFLMRDGRPLARFAHRRLREKPPTGGVSVYREAIPLADDVEAYSLRLLEDFQWSGVAMVEFRRSSDDGQAYLMEVNGRFWGSLQLAIDAGVDFPRLLVESALGLPIEPIREYRVGVRSRWWLGDADHLLVRLRDAARAQHPHRELVPAMGAIARFLLPWRPGDRSEVMRLSDASPGLRELRDWMTSLGSRGSPATGAGRSHGNS